MCVRQVRPAGEDAWLGGPAPELEPHEGIESNPLAAHSIDAPPLNATGRSNGAVGAMVQSKAILMKVWSGLYPPQRHGLAALWHGAIE